MSFSLCNGQFKRMPYGKERREKILENIKARMDAGYTGLPVNRRWQMNIEKDQDLRYLLKKGKVKRVRVHESAFSWIAQTYLVIK